MNRTVRVLVAEDNEDHLFLTVRALRNMPGVTLDIDTVADGQQALDYLHGENGYAQAKRPDLILLDIKMPKVDGLDVLRKLKSNPALRAIPTVMLTSSERPEDIDLAHVLGGNSYVTKPASVTSLTDRIAALGRYWTQLASLPSSNAC